jgi:UDP-N-acetylenolpyruvoylglucosamine reductase
VWFARVTWRFAGAGANAWFSDLGEDGCVIRCRSGCVPGIDVRGDEVIAHCGWMGPALLDRLEREGLRALSTSTACRGNAGGLVGHECRGHGGDIGMRVTWIRCLNQDGEIVILDPLIVDFLTALCRLRGCVALTCGLG